MHEHETTTHPEVSDEQTGAQRAPLNEDPVFRLASSDVSFCRLYNVKTWLRLGGGATACVVRLFNRLRHENVAVKIFVQPRGDIQLKIAAEVRITDKVVSANVVRVFGPHEGDSFMWIEMEYVEGQTLKEYLDDHHHPGQAMAIGEAVDLGIEIVRGVVALHSAGVVHRDLKPENILLPASGTPRAKIADFGIARLWEQQRSTQTSEWRGTPTYGAPETFTSSTTTDRSRVAPLTPEADIYSLGVLLFRMLTGEFVFPVRDEGDTYEVVAAHLHGQPLRARILNMEVPADVEQLLVQMVARNPSDRPRLQQVLEVLERHTSSEARRRSSEMPSPPAPNHEATSTAAPGPAQSAWPRLTPAQRQAAPIAMGVAALLVAAGFFFRSGADTKTRVPMTDAAAAPSHAPYITPTSQPVTIIPVAQIENSSPTIGAGASPRSLPTRASSRTAASPAVPSAARTSAVTVEVQRDGVILANGGVTKVSGVDLVVIAADGSRYQFGDADAMEPGAQMMVPFVMFQPEVPNDAHLRRVDVVLGPGRRDQERFSRRLD